MKFTICFPIKDGKVLMIKRIKQPWLGRWNGLGGHIEDGENPTASVMRETLEETGIDMHSAKRIDYKGIVTWNVEEKNDTIILGMFAFVAELGEGQAIWNEDRETREGILAWKSIEWICTIGNKEVADNVPYFLSDMLRDKKTHRYHCIFENGKLVEVKILPLAKEFAESV